MAAGLLGRSTIFFVRRYRGSEASRRGSMTRQKFGERVEELGGLYAQSSSAYADEGMES